MWHSYLLCLFIYSLTSFIFSFLLSLFFFPFQQADKISHLHKVAKVPFLNLKATSLFFHSVLPSSPSPPSLFYPCPPNWTWRRFLHFSFPFGCLVLFWNAVLLFFSHCHKPPALHFFFSLASFHLLLLSPPSFTPPHFLAFPSLAVGRRLLSWWTTCARNWLWICPEVGSTAVFRLFWLQWR